MAKMYYENDADMSVFDDKTVGIIGYGSQGHAHALNLHESGVNVMVGLYEGSKSKEMAEAKLLMKAVHDGHTPRCACTFVWVSGGRSSSK